jgi:hypothetical protein
MLSASDTKPRSDLVPLTIDRLMFLPMGELYGPRSTVRGKSAKKFSTFFPSHGWLDWTRWWTLINSSESNKYWIKCDCLWGKAAIHCSRGLDGRGRLQSSPIDRKYSTGVAVSSPVRSPSYADACWRTLAGNLQAGLYIPLVPKFRTWVICDYCIPF